MAINSLSDYAVAAKQSVLVSKTPGNLLAQYSTWASSGATAAGSLSIGNTANGLVPTNATAGAADIATFGGSGYVTRVYALNVATASAAGKVLVYDRLFHCGSYAFNASTTLTSQPSFSSRVPGGTDFTGLQIWVEIALAMAGALSVAVTYTNQSGATAHTTGTVATGLTTPGTVFQLPLASGDSGVSVIESVTGSVSSAGTFNIFVARPIWMWSFTKFNEQVSFPIESLGVRQVWPTSCLAMIYNQRASGNSNPLEVILEIASK